MKRTFAYSLAIVFAGTLIALSSRLAISSGQGGALVRLQSATPGAVQTGHVNVSGTVLAGRVGIGTSSPTYPLHVVTSSNSIGMILRNDTAASSYGLVVSAAEGQGWAVQD